MIKVEAAPKTVEQMAERLRVRGRAVFGCRKTRDAVVKHLRGLGVTCLVNRLPDFNLHARHVEDFVGEWTNQTHEYKRVWEHLYTAQLV